MVLMVEEAHLVTVGGEVPPMAGQELMEGPMGQLESTAQRPMVGQERMEGPMVGWERMEGPVVGPLKLHQEPLDTRDRMELWWRRGPHSVRQGAVEPCHLWES